MCETCFAQTYEHNLGCDSEVCAGTDMCKCPDCEKGMHDCRCYRGDSD